MPNEKVSGINSLFKDYVAPMPKANSNDWGNTMGTPIEDAPAPTKGEINGVQFAKLDGGDAGSKGFGPGKK